MDVLDRVLGSGPQAVAVPQCVACGKQIEPLPGAKEDSVAVNVGGAMSAVSLGVLYQGVACERCGRSWCTNCWVPLMLEDKDNCDRCGVKLVPLTSKLLS